MLIRKIASAAVFALLALAMTMPASAAADPLMDWAQPLQLDTGSAEPELTSVSCPSATFCAATGTLGRLYTSTDPTDPASWTEATLAAGEIGNVSCASPTWCVAVGPGPTLLYSTDPGGGAGAWDAVSLPEGRRISCPSQDFCARLAGDDEVLTSTEPLGGAGTWTATDLNLPEWRLGPNVLHRLDCPTAQLCVVAGDVGTVVASADPTGGVETWVKSFIGAKDSYNNGAGPSVEGLDCTVASFCVATTWGGTIATTDEPLGGTSAWDLSRNESAFFIQQISCAEDASLCVGVDRNGYAITSRDPAALSAAWGTFELIDEPEILRDVSCAPDGSLCVAVDRLGRAIVGTRHEDEGPVPGGGGSTPPGHGGPLPSPPHRPPCRPKPDKSHRKASKGGAISQAKAVAGKRSKGRCARRAA
jgi:putative hemolysin